MTLREVDAGEDDAGAGEPPVLVERDGAVASLVLNRPSAVNSIDGALARAFRARVAQLDEDESVRALVLRGAGKMFCAGGDLVSFAGHGRQAPAYIRALIGDLHAGLKALATFHAPIIASVHGAAAGAGLGLAMAADIVLAGESSRFVMAYTRAGLTPDGGTSWLLSRTVGLRQALRLTLTNPVVTAREALDLGLVSEVVADEALGERTADLARSLAQGPTAAYVTARGLLRGSTHVDYSAQLEREAEEIVAAFATEDGLEGISAFLEHRAPVFRGR